jgi:hypothetical protein
MKYVGPESYTNWNVFLSGGSLEDAFEFPLVSDAHVTGEIGTGLGPYKWLNPAASGDVGRYTQAVVIRVENFLTLDPQEAIRRTERTDTGSYHGGWIEEELAALTSLFLGIRAQPGAISRSFRKGDDPMGRPVGYMADRSRPPFPTPPYPIIPQAVRTCSLNELNHLQGFAEIGPTAAVSLVRAARLYQAALWNAEADPSQSWIQLVGAVEVAAGYWRAGEEQPVDVLRVQDEVLAALLLSAGGAEHLEAVASRLAPTMGATRKFREFLMRFLPAVPDVRPGEAGRLDWSTEQMKKSLSLVYGHRSKALHGGIPFPPTMCEPPATYDEWSAPAEVPTSVAAYRMGGSWLRKDTPMLLHTFEYIVRGALLRWWREDLAHSRGT